MLIGSFLHNVDKKGRVFIPAKMREDLGDSFFVSIPIDGQPCLTIYTADQWEKLQDSIDALPMLKRKELKRVFGPMTTQVECDVQGRVLIPQTLRDYAGLNDSAYIVGTTDDLEIWNKERWESRQSEINADNLAALVSTIDF